LRWSVGLGVLTAVAVAAVGILTSPVTNVAGLALTLGSVGIGALVTTLVYPITYDVSGGREASELKSIDAYLTAEANLAKELGGKSGPTNFYVLITENEDGTYKVETVGLDSNNEPVVVSQKTGEQLKQIFNEGNGGVKPEIIVSQPTPLTVRKVVSYAQ
jgi:hypothetical protein